MQSTDQTPPCVSALIYSVPNRKIIQVSIILESVQEVRDNPLVEFHNKQQISRWVRSHLHLPSLQRQLYTEWDIQEACRRRIMVKSTYADILKECGVPKITIFRTFNVLLPPLDCTYLKYLWDLILILDVKNERVRVMISITTVKNWRSNFLPQI